MREYHKWLRSATLNTSIPHLFDNPTPLKASLVRSTSGAGQRIPFVHKGVCAFVTRHLMALKGKWVQHTRSVILKPECRTCARKLCESCEVGR